MFCCHHFLAFNKFLRKIFFHFLPQCLFIQFQQLTFHQNKPIYWNIYAKYENTRKNSFWGYWLPFQKHLKKTKKNPSEPVALRASSFICNFFCKSSLLLQRNNGTIAKWSYYIIKRNVFYHAVEQQISISHGCMFQVRRSSSICPFEHIN